MDRRLSKDTPLISRMPEKNKGLSGNDCRPTIYDVAHLDFQISIE